MSNMKLIFQKSFFFILYTRPGFERPMFRTEEWGIDMLEPIQCIVGIQDWERKPFPTTIIMDSELNTLNIMSTLRKSYHEYESHTSYV